MGICNISRLRPNRHGSSLTTVYYHLCLLSHDCIIINGIIQINRLYIISIMDINYGIELQITIHITNIVVIIINCIMMMMTMNDLNEIFIFTKCTISIT